MSVLTVGVLGVRLGSAQVLAEVSFEVGAGELVTLVGPNGAGKTTLLRALVGLVPHQQGTVHIEGRSARRRGRVIGYVPQRTEFAWDYPISVEQVVMTGLVGRIGMLRRPGAADWSDVDAALRRVRMDDLRERPVGQLSGGQRQRVLVARALALGAPVLLLDEPLTGLDVPTQDLLTELFRSLADEGRAVVMSTHDVATALYTSDRLLLLNRTLVADSHGSLLRTPEPWVATFGVSTDSPFLRILQAV